MTDNTQPTEAMNVDRPFDAYGGGARVLNAIQEVLDCGGPWEDALARAKSALLDLRPSVQSVQPSPSGDAVQAAKSALGSTLDEEGHRFDRTFTDDELSRAATAALSAAYPVMVGRIEELEGYVREQIAHVEARIDDGKEMGASVWRIALEDVARKNRAILANKGSDRG